MCQNQCFDQSFKLSSINIKLLHLFAYFQLHLGLVGLLARFMLGLKLPIRVKLGLGLRLLVRVTLGLGLPASVTLGLH